MVSVVTASHASCFTPAETLSAAATVRNWAGGAPAVIIGDRPGSFHGIASGDVIWSRADRSSRMEVEWAAGSDGSKALCRFGPVVGPETDFTGKMDLPGLPDTAQQKETTCAHPKKAS